MSVQRKLDAWDFVLLAVLILFIGLVAVFEDDGDIRDLQRRVGQLEQVKK